MIGKTVDLAFIFIGHFVNQSAHTATLTAMWLKRLIKKLGFRPI
jgi:hypothetical protein